MMPLTTVPTERPRSCGRDITAAKGTSCWGTQLTTPRPKDAAMSAQMPGANAAARPNKKATAICPSTSLRRSKRSPSGNRKASPNAKPSSAAPATRSTVVRPIPRSDEINGRIG
ncbi:hypothetical protein D3C87_1301970 [compost metagenome]